MGRRRQWLQERLSRAGLRPINNVVDVTNYVMLEFNQPLHAFDLDTVTNHHVVIRRANEGEEFTTLDGVNRKLSTDNLLIADTAQAIGIGGVMGGANSEITASTTNMLLESATFHPLNNRRTSTDLNLRTEASLRFEKGLRPELAPIALRRATQLILETAGGQAASGIIDVFPGGDTGVAAVPLTVARLRQVLGMDLDIARAETVLASLGIVTRRTGPDSLEADPPYWRSDIAIEEDLIEEVIRIIGYDEVPTTMLSSPIPYHRPNAMTALKDALRDALAAAGMQETISYPLVSLEDMDRLNVNGEADGEPSRGAEGGEPDVRRAGHHASDAGGQHPEHFGLQPGAQRWRVPPVRAGKGVHSASYGTAHRTGSGGSGDVRAAIRCELAGLGRTTGLLRPVGNAGGGAGPARNRHVVGIA